MSQQRPVAIQRAPLPFDLVFLPDQTRLFGDPQEQEEAFQKRHGVLISHSYLKTVTKMFREIMSKCSVDSDSVFDRFSEVLYLNGEITAKRIDLHYIVVRPCFEGYGMLALTVYQLVKAARINAIPIVRICDCCTKTVAALHHIFGDLIKSYDENSARPDYELSDLWQFSAENLRLSGKIVDDTSNVIRLKPAAFPTSIELNNQAFVTTHFRVKYGAQSMWKAPKMDHYAAAWRIEQEFQRTVGMGPGPNYIASINHMLAAFGRECNDKKIYEHRDIQKQTDTVFMHLCLLVKNDVSTVELKRIAVRPCFEGNHIVTILIYQTIRLGLAMDATRMVISCPKARWVAEQKLGASSFDKLKELYETTPADWLGISDAIADEEHTVLTLDPSAFPLASTLNRRRQRLIDVQRQLSLIYR